MGRRLASKSIGTDFTSGPVMPLLLKFFLPFLLANMLNSLYNTVDTIIIGRYIGNAGIVAVSMGGKMLNLYISISVALAAGGQTLISQLVGANQRNELNSTIGTMFAEMGALSAAFAVVTILLSRSILSWLNTPADSFADALVYLRITSLGLPLLFGYSAVSSVLQGMGDSKGPLIFIAIAAAVNLVGNLVFVTIFGFGVAGTAIATVIGQGASLAFSITALFKKMAYFGFDFSSESFRMDLEKLKIMLKIGLPMVLRSLSINITQLILMGYVNLYGITQATAYSIGDKIIHMANIFQMAARQASTSMIGQNIGARRNDRVRSILKCSMLVTMSAAVALSAVSLLCPKAIFGLFTDDGAVMSYAQPLMRVSCLIYLLSAAMSPYEAVVSGTGNSFLGMTAGLLDGVVFRVSFSFLFVNIFDMGVVGFFMGDALARLGPLFVGGIYYYTGAWERFRRLVT